MADFVWLVFQHCQFSELVIVYQGRHSPVFVVTFGEFAGEKRIFGCSQGNGPAEDDNLWGSVWTGLVKGTKTVVWLVGEGGGDGYGIQTALVEMAGKLGDMAGIPGAWPVVMRLGALPWQHEAKWVKSFSRRFSLPSDVVRFLVTSFAQRLNPALSSDRDVESEN